MKSIAHKFSASTELTSAFNLLSLLLNLNGFRTCYFQISDNTSSKPELLASAISLRIFAHFRLEQVAYRSKLLNLLFLLGCL